MTQIKLQKLKLTNFKGVRDLEISAKKSTIKIYGANEAGKTSVFDAFCWLLFGKDSENRQEFDIKTLDKNNNPIHRLTHSVEGDFLIAETKLSVKREYKEKWQKKHGESQQEFTGHETKFYVDDIPVAKKDYQETIQQIIPEEIFKLITSPFYFNSLEWKKRREIVFEVAGEIEDSEVAETEGKFQDLLKLLDNKDFEQYKAKINADKAKIKKALADIPARIDEVKQGMPEPVDIKQVKTELAAIKKDIEAVDIQIEQRTNQADSKRETYNKYSSELIDIQKQLAAIEKNAKEKAEYDNQQKEQKRQEQIKQLQKQANELSVTISRQQDLINKERAERLAEKKEKLLEKYTEETNKEYDPDSLTCPLTQEDCVDPKQLHEKLNQSFKQAQQQSVNEIVAEGKRIAKELEEQTKINNEAENYVNSNKPGLESIKSELEKLQLTGVKSGDIDYGQKHAELKEKEKTLQELINNFEFKVVDVSDLKQQKEPLEERKKELYSLQNNNELIQKDKLRIKELEKQEKTLNNELAGLEGIEHTMFLFEKTKIEMMEKKIKDKFKGVDFKMFNMLVNGGIEPTCKTLINGVPFETANNAARINTGIKIINTLCEHYAVNAPIFIDNAEAVNEVEKSKSQQILLYVVPEGFETDDGIVLKK